MPKQKTSRSAAKRFKRTAKGLIKRGHAYKRHILTSKSQKRKRGLRKSALVAKSDREKVKRLLGL